MAFPEPQWRDQCAYLRLNSTWTCYAAPASVLFFSTTSMNTKLVKVILKMIDYVLALLEL